MNPLLNKESYLGNPNVKKDGVNEEWDETKIKEYAKCMNDPAYFARTYVKIISLDQGLVNFDLYPYQEKMFEHFNDNRFSIFLHVDRVVNQYPVWCIFYGMPSFIQKRRLQS